MAMPQPAREFHRTTHQLVLRIHGGDREAFNQLFMRYYPRIKLLVRLHMMEKLKAQVEVEDVIQEIYMEVYKNFHKFEYRDPDSFYKWVVTVIGWKISDFNKYFFRTAKRQAGETLSLQHPFAGQGEEELGTMEDALKGKDSTPSQIVMEKEGYRMLERALEQLPVHFRRAIQLRQIEKRSAKETAEILDMKPGSVNVLFHRAQNRLHEILREMSYFNG
ncbi:MAG TPA: sigma-70 family RNA polymerase sigma factor [Planctomycetota bacterium]|nr:sigma-70 family RNA polymerase sigma factor [Planctomycetota bacterium]